MLKHYVEFLHPFFLLGGSTVREVEERDEKKVECDDGCIGFRFFDRTVVVIEGEVLTGEKKNYSPWYYFGERMSPKAVEEEYPNDPSLVKFMKDKGCDAVKTEFGQLIALNDEDVVL